MTIWYKSDDLARYTDLSTGAAQLVAIQSQDWNLVLANPSKYSYITNPPYTAQIIAVPLQVNEYPTNITLVRQAIVHAINYSNIDQSVFFNQMTPAVGPEYPAWSQFYDLGNYTPYQFNLTLAENDLAQAGFANGTGLPTITFTAISSCTYCGEIGQIVQADLSQIGITVNLEELESSAYYAPYGTYSTNFHNANQMGQLSILGGEVWAPGA